MDLRDKYDTSNPMIAQIIQAKEERLKLLQELRKEYEKEFQDDPPLYNPLLPVQKKKIQRRTKTSEGTPPPLPTRRSLRISNGPVNYRFYEYDDDDDDDSNEGRPKKTNNRFYTASTKVKVKRPRPPNSYGHIPGIEVGEHWDTRIECSDDAVHRPTVAGIHAGEEGAYSIALSGGYPEDVDEGETFTYTGAGGRDLKGTRDKPKNLRTAPQTKNQELTGVNYSLVRNIETRKPIRVIRGYKSPSVYAPEFGYRYDGLYEVLRYWEDIGKTGFRVYRFEMSRLKDQPPPPWSPEFVKPEKRDRNFEDEEHVESEKDEVDDCEYTSTILSEKLMLLESEESEVDTEIKIYKERLCKDSIFLSADFNAAEESSFYGWD